ncbi:MULTISPECIES: GTPase Era [Neisseria]|jgi:GTP-binding protein era|uniref:GTPase Era n=2 Tax=Neisseria TaxID=482 RepID=C0EKE6_NEIFL|nr:MULTISPECIES: GTPase Era [Neisseria]SPY04737.1 GTP-binding protein Era [Neisseria meningitidis]EEG34412.1 ribosome biogenesis GTPase Era [Neisseria flavescens NRL30031/H210]KZC82081.1 GTP-binding protein Era [Neisseria flavescens]KZC86691.1 GTP-binding protein Era [Neisseria flavescens]MBF1277154.1 GTPase Era [Neisseria sp.]
MDIETFLQNESQHPTDYRCGFVAIVGRPNVGKSTLMNHLIGQKISITSKKAQTTRNRVTGIYTDDTAQFVFVDTPGFQTNHRNALNDRLNQNVTEALSGVDVVVFVVEAMRFTDADRVVLKQLPKHTPVVLVVNKIDKDKAKDKFALEAFINEVRQEFEFTASEAVSAKHGLRIANLLELLKPYLPESIPMYPEDMVTDKSSRFLAMEIVREKLFRYLGEELPYAMNVEVEQFEEEESGLFRIYIAVLVDKDSQKAILIGKGGEKLKKISTEARLDMEKLFDTKVFLKIWVKVKSGWADDIRFLRELGL